MNYLIALVFGSDSEKFYFSVVFANLSPALTKYNFSSFASAYVF